MSLFEWIFFGPAKLIALWPYTGYVFGALLIAAELVLTLHAHESVWTIGLAFFRRAPVFAGLLWWIFNAYERQTVATGAAALRIDLMVLVPILYVLTIAAIVTIVRKRGSPDSRQES